MLRASSVDVAAVSPAQRVSHAPHSAHLLPHPPSSSPSAAAAQGPPAQTMAHNSASSRGGLCMNSLLSDHAQPPLGPPQPLRPALPSQQLSPRPGSLSMLMQPQSQPQGQTHTQPQPHSQSLAQPQPQTQAQTQAQVPAQTQAQILPRPNQQPKTNLPTHSQPHQQLQQQRQPHQQHQQRYQQQNQQQHHQNQDQDHDQQQQHLHRQQQQQQQQQQQPQRQPQSLQETQTQDQRSLSQSQSRPQSNPQPLPQSQQLTLPQPLLQEHHRDHPYANHTPQQHPPLLRLHQHISSEHRPSNEAYAARHEYTVHQASYQPWDPPTHQQPQQLNPLTSTSGHQTCHARAPPPMRSAINISSLINDSSPRQLPVDQAVADTTLVPLKAEEHHRPLEVQTTPISIAPIPRPARETTQDRPKQKRYRATPEQLKLLLATFDGNPAPNSEQLAELGAKIQMPLQSVVLWFKNRRARVPHPMVQSAAAGRPSVHQGGPAPLSQSSMASTGSVTGQPSHATAGDQTSVHSGLPVTTPLDNDSAATQFRRVPPATTQKRKYKKTGAYSKRKKETVPIPEDPIRKIAVKVDPDLPMDQVPETPPGSEVIIPGQAPRSSPRLQAKAAAAAAAMASMASGERLPPLAVPSFQLAASASSRAARLPQTPKLTYQREYKPSDAVEVLENGRGCVRSWYSASVVGKVSSGALPTPLSLSSPATPHSASQAAAAGMHMVANAASLAGAEAYNSIDNPVPILTSLRNDGSGSQARGSERKSPRRVSSPMASPALALAKAKYMVRYAHLVRDTDSMVPLEEIVVASRLRPAPPTHDDSKWKPQVGDAVEAHCDDAWFVVEIKSYTLRKGYLVAFEQGENQWIRRNSLRPCRVWRGGCDWTIKTKVPVSISRKANVSTPQALDESDGPAAEALLSLDPGEMMSPGRRSRRLEEKVSPITRPRSGRTE